MLRYAIGGASGLALVMAGFFLWKGNASADTPAAAKAAPAAVASGYDDGQAPRGFGRSARFVPPTASEKSKEEKRFDRADKNNDGRILLAELLEPRKKAFAKLDKDGNGQLSFDEWAAKTEDKFAQADGDRSGWLNPAEFASTAPKRKAKPARCACG